MAHQIILVGSEKGGVGKTSISFNLAVLRAKAGVPVLLVDADRQASSSMWSSMRTEAGHQPPMVCVQKSGKIGYDLIQLRENYEVIIDAGGADSVELRQGIAVCDTWIIPVRASQLDLFSMAKMRQLQDDVEQLVGKFTPAFVVLNAIAPRTREASDARTLLDESTRMPVLQSQLVDRVAMRRSVMLGCGVTELTGKDYDGRAATEILALYEEIFKEKFRVQR